VRLTKLKLAGFKSFVDPTSVLLPGQLVGVVGPNGCGKSNIIDAVRWVLGESRASALRGESMQDVLFNGSSQRKPVGRASVELVFDNSLGRAVGQWSQYAEISVKRVLERAGESAYYINSAHVRRRDVIDLFLGTGLGPRAYAIIEQGMISEIIEARPEELRLFLEEAAGVSKYKERRRETENRLSDARDNLARLEDIRNELGVQIEKLEAQAEVAGRYQQLKTDLNERQGLLWLLKKNHAHAERERGAREIERNATRLEAETAALRETEKQVERLRETRARVELRLTQLAAEQVQWSAQRQAFAADQTRWQELLENARQRVATQETRHAESASALPLAEQKLKATDDAAGWVRREAAQAEQQLRVEETQRMNTLRALDALKQRRERLEQDRAAQQQ